MDLSNDADASVLPFGWNLALNMSPSWPDNSMMGARRLDVRGGPYKESNSKEWSIIKAFTDLYSVM